MTMIPSRNLSTGAGAAASLLLLALISMSTPVAAAQPGPDPKLVGTWYWETSKYISAGEYSTLIKTTRTIVIRADGTYSFVQVGIVEGKTSSQNVLKHSGTFTQQGNTLAFTTTDGQKGM